MYRKLNEMVKMYKAKLKKDILYCFLNVSCLIKADYTYRDFDCSNIVPILLYIVMKNHNGKHTITCIALTLLL